MKCFVEQCSFQAKKKRLCLRHYRALYYRLNKAKELTKVLNYKRSRYGRLYVSYKLLKHRCEGRYPIGPRRLYKGLPFLSKLEFLDWAANQSDYHRLYDDWVKHDFAYALTPTVDRIDPKIGYLIGNIRWLPFKKNARRQ